MEEKKQVHAELKPYRAIFKMDETLKIPENTLEKLLPQEVKRTYGTSKKSENWFMDLYESMTADYFAKLTTAGVLAVVLGIIIIFGIGAIDSFAQTDLTTTSTTGSAQDQGSNATSAATSSLGEHFL